MRMKLRGTMVGPAATIILAGLVLAIGLPGCRDAEPETSTIDVEKIIDFTGVISVTLPSGEITRIAVGQTLIPLPEDTLVEIVSGESTGMLAGKIILLKEGQIARIIRPGVTAHHVIRFTGELKIVLPDGTVIFVKAGDPLPILPAGTRIEVISGELVVLWGDERITLTAGDVAWLELRPEDRLLELERGDISPASPFRP
ncbi:MAG: hypothetical protein P9M08_08330 [Candidatus Erginobacter occultus]|nr:hypothetical protein [Candidatus Erginobacter occultus]